VLVSIANCGLPKRRRRADQILHFARERFGVTGGE
jgi:hypothetical protein